MQANWPRRGVRLESDRTVIVQDEVAAPDKAVTLCWVMLTRASVALGEPRRARLTQAGQSLAFRVLEPAGVVLTIYPTDPPPAARRVRWASHRRATAGGVVKRPLTRPAAAFHPFVHHCVSALRKIQS